MIEELHKEKLEAHSRENELPDICAECDLDPDICAECDLDPDICGNDPDDCECSAAEEVAENNYEGARDAYD